MTANNTHAIGLKGSIHQLMAQLTSFGLNPLEWHLMAPPQDGGEVLYFAHRQDRDFRLQAEISVRRTRGSHSVRLRSLRLASL